MAALEGTTPSWLRPPTLQLKHNPLGRMAAHSRRTLKLFPIVCAVFSGALRIDSCFAGAWRTEAMS